MIRRKQTHLVGDRKRSGSVRGVTGRVSRSPLKGSATARGAGKELVQSLPSVPRDADANEPVGSRYESASAIQLYMREVGQVKLLKPVEEVELARRIRRGDENARQHMIKANLRLVVKIAREYEGLGLPLLDLINEGNIGLMRAVEKFDPRKGSKLSTYSSWWIKQSMRRALAGQSKTIRLPVHVVDKIYRLRRAEMKLHEALEREPTEEELACELGITARRVSALRRAAIRPASLDSPLGDEDSSRLGEVVEDPAAEIASDLMDEQTVASKVLEYVEALDERERKIIRQRFALDGGREKTLEELGQQFGLTRERIRQLQNLALVKIRRQMEEFESIRTAQTSTEI